MSSCALAEKLGVAQRGAVAACFAADADFAQQQKAAPSDKPPPPAQRLKLQTDALLDGLITKLEPKI